MSWLIHITLRRVKETATMALILRIMQTIKSKQGCIGKGIDKLSVKNMHPKQIENLINQSAQDRYEYFIRYCADFETVCGLVVGEDNWVIFRDQSGDEIFPLWPHPDLAEACCFDEHKEMNATPQLIGLESFINNCVPDMVEDNVLFSIFYSKDREGLAIDGMNLKSALQEEISGTWE